MWKKGRFRKRPLYDCNFFLFYGMNCLLFCKKVKSMGQPNSRADHLKQIHRNRKRIARHCRLGGLFATYNKSKLHNGSVDFLDFHISSILNQITKNEEKEKMKMKVQKTKKKGELSSTRTINKRIQSTTMTSSITRRNNE